MPTIPSLSIYPSIYLATTMLHVVYRNVARQTPPVLCKLNQSKIPMNTSAIFIFKNFRSIQVYILNLKLDYSNIADSSKTFKFNFVKKSNSSC